jgi:hypothetical protein
LLSLPCDEVFTTDQTNSLLWFEKLNQISQFDLKKKNSEMPTIAIKLTASGLLYNSSKFKDDELIFTVPYSNHSSASELAQFLDFLHPNSVERIVKTKPQKSVSSVIDSYLATRKAAEMTDDITSDSMELSSFESPVFKSQVSDFFHSAVSQFQSPEPIATVETEYTALTEDMDDEIPMELESPIIPVATQKSPFSTIISGELEDAVTKANSIIVSIFSDLDQIKEDHNNDYIYSDDLIEKLISLHKIYQPFTGVPLSN